MFFHGSTTLKCLFQRRYILSYVLSVKLTDFLLHHSQNTALTTQKNKSWAASKLCLDFQSSLRTRNYQYSKMIEMRGGYKFHDGGTSCSCNSI